MTATLICRSRGTTYFSELRLCRSLAESGDSAARRRLSRLLGRWCEVFIFIKWSDSLVGTQSPRALSLSPSEILRNERRSLHPIRKRQIVKHSLCPAESCLFNRYICFSQLFMKLFLSSCSNIESVCSTDVYLHKEQEVRPGPSRSHVIIVPVCSLVGLSCYSPPPPPLHSHYLSLSFLCVSLCFRTFRKLVQDKLTVDCF